MPGDRLPTAQRLYEAFAAHDAKALLAVLTPGFRGALSEGMPDGLGGAYDSAQTTLRQCWARVLARLDLRPVPAEHLPVSDNRIIMPGRSKGTARAARRPPSAAFAHMLRLAGGRVSELVQITETARGRSALAR